MHHILLVFSGSIVFNLAGLVLHICCLLILAPPHIALP